MPNSWLISDTHLDHKNIIRYCNRPFPTTKIMNNTIIHLWYDTVMPKDTVYFLGDLSMGNTRQWLNQLPGEIVFIKGNHDQGVPTIASKVLPTELGDIFLVHNPYDASDWPGWAIHGHVHNRRPFIDFNQKRINVSVEVIGYKPVNLDIILDIIKRGCS